MKQKTFFILIFILSIFTKQTAFAQDQYVGEIRMFAGNFAPSGWALCDGSIISIAQNTALFSLLGTYYGGNGSNTFGLPDLRGRSPISSGYGAGLSNYSLGEAGGSESVTLMISQLPSHSHTVNAVSTVGNQENPLGNSPADTKVLDKEYSDGTSNSTMNIQMIAPSGGNQPFSIRPPYLAVNFIIALEGIYPSRP
jgi:microcystin-dependent protein